MNLISQTISVIPTREEFLFMEGLLPKLLFYGLTFLSIGMMLWQFFSMYLRWRKGRKIDWKPDPIGGILKFVVGQKKVMGSRPKTGAPMHMLIFYGFLGLFVATTLLALATYSPLIGLPNWHKGGYYLAYEAIFDLLGLVFVIGVVWALVRRMKTMSSLGVPIKDSETGKLSYSKNPQSSDWSDFAVLGLLLILGVSGFFLEAGRISSQPQPWDGFSFVGFSLSKMLPEISPLGYKVIWWQHMVWVWAFFIYLPQMRLRHILVGTISSALAPEREMGQLIEPPIAATEGESPMGAAIPFDLSQWHLISLDACMECGRCTEVCPAYGVGKILNPKQIVQDSILAGKNGSELSHQLDEDALWACTTCNACVEACPVLIRHTDIIVESRRNLVSEGKLSGTATVVLKQMASTGSAWGQESKDREAWMKGLDVPLCRETEEFDYLLFVGCAGATDPAAVKTTKALASLLKKAGVKFACLGQEESCTGDPARRIGDEFTFIDQAKKNVSVFERYGIKKVVTACPHCFNTLLNEYGHQGIDLEVVHHTQLLAELVLEGKLKPANVEKGEVTFHDPCYLARVNGVSDPARILVGDETGYDTEIPYVFQDQNQAQSPVRVFAEPEHHARKTLCCGAGGGRMWMEEEPNQRPTNRRSEELLATGAKTVAVACPFCRIMLDTGVKQISDEEINLVDLAEMLKDANT